jgi:hypothetical protein
MTDHLLDPVIGTGVHDWDDAVVDGFDVQHPLGPCHCKFLPFLVLHFVQAVFGSRFVGSNKAHVLADIRNERLICDG